MINVGIIGYGKMGRIRHQVISSIKNAQVDSVYDPANIITEIEKVQSPDQIIKNPKIDAVFICTPNYLNKPLTIQILQTGKHVFCEKPPAFTAEDVEKIRTVEKESGKVLMYGFNHRYHESVQDALQILRSGELGGVINMRGTYGKAKLITFNQPDWRTKREIAGGGVLLDQGIHMVTQFGNTLFCVLTPSTDLKPKRFTDHCDCKSAGLFSKLCYYWYSSRSGTTAHACRQEYHIRTLN